MATYTLTDGTRKTQLTISGDTTVVFPTKLDYFGVRSLDGANILVSKIKAPTILEDGVYSTDEGDGDVVVDDGVFTDTLYLKGSGTVVVYGGAKSNHLPFKVGGKGGGGSGGDNTHYKGTTTTAISNGSTTNPITIDGESYTAVFGDIVVYGYTEFVFDGTAWSEFGRPFDTTPTSGSANAVTSDGIYWRTPLARGGVNNTSAAGGETTTAQGRDCFAYGYYASAGAGNVSYATAFGYNTQARYDYLFACGTTNNPKNGDLFEIGNGTGSSRSNILEVNRTRLNVNGDIKKNGVSLPTPYTTMPTITEAMLGQIAMYVGTTDANYTQGWFYIASSDGAAEPTYSWVNLPTSPRTYSETVLWEGNLTTTQTEIQLSNAYTNYDEIRIIGRNSGSETDYIETRQTVSTWGIDEYRGLFTQDNRVWLYPKDATTLKSGSIVTIYLQKVIGIKY